MPPSRPSMLPVVALAAAVVSCTSADRPAAPPNADHLQVVPVTPNDEWAPNLRPADFSPGGANPYFPLVPGTRSAARTSASRPDTASTSSTVRT